MEKKKKPTNYIIPATFFTALSPVAKSIAKPIVEVKPDTKITQTENTKPKTSPDVKPVLKNVTRRSSSLSLKSVHFKKEEKKEVVLDENFDNHPKDNFTQKELENAWKLYHSILIKQGKKSIAATFNADLPALKESFEITLTLPNTLMQDQIEKERPNLLKHLRTELNNYGIKISILVNETVTKKFAYTPQEKYDKLLETNPAMAVLKEVFKLGL